MERERVVTLPLAAFLAAVAGVLGWGLVLRAGPWTIDGAVQELRDRDLEGSERRRLLAMLVRDSAAAVPTDRTRWLRAAMAALALDDEAAWQQRMGKDWLPRQRDEAALLAEWTFGDPLLTTLCAAMVAEAAGDRAAASARYACAARSGRLFHHRLAVALAQQGAGRLH